MKRRNALAAIALPLFQGCSYQRYFTLDWNEEVRLFDGQVIWVRLKYTYQRLTDFAMPSFYTPSILRITELTWNAGSLGRVHETFEKHSIVALQFIAQTWYLILETEAGTAYEDGPNGIPIEKWGPPEDREGHKYVKLTPFGIVHAAANEIPAEYMYPNILQIMSDANTLLQFNDTNVSLRKKSEYQAEHPLNPGEMNFKRRQ